MLPASPYASHERSRGPRGRATEHQTPPFWGRMLPSLTSCNHQASAIAGAEGIKYNMLKVRVVLLALVAVFVASAAASAVAQAQTGPVWHVNGSKLEAGKTKAITDKNVAGKEAKLKGTIAGAEVVILCKTVKSSGILIGGSPGKDEETIEFSNCKVEGQENCVVTVANTVAQSELDHSPTKMLTDFKTPGNFTTITIKSGEKTCLSTVSNAPVKVASGDTYGLACENEPEGTEAEVNILSCPETAIKTVEQNGKTAGVGLEFDGKPAIFSDKAEVELVTKEKFGVFQT
jgi:hypothetical protein